MPKYITAPNGNKLKIVEDKRSASGYRAVPVENSERNPFKKTFQNMPLSVNKRNAVIKKETRKAAALKEFKASGRKTSGKK